MHEVDMTEFNASIQRLLKMGEVRRRDISEVFRKADKGIISLARATVGKSPKGMKSKKYPARTHTSGNLRRGIGFAVSKKRNLVYYIRPRAWYAMIYAHGHHSWPGNPFMERAVSIKEGQTNRLIREGLSRLVEKVKNGK